MPTYRNDSTTTSYVVTGTDNLKRTVPIGMTVETYDPVVPADFTLTAATPRLTLTVVSGESAASYTDELKPEGHFSVSIQHSGQVGFVGEVHLLRSLDGFTTYGVRKAYGGEAEEVLEDWDSHATYKLGVPANGIYSGAIVLRLSR